MNKILTTVVSWIFAWLISSPAVAHEVDKTAGDAGKLVNGVATSLAASYCINRGDEKKIQWADWFSTKDLVTYPKGQYNVDKKVYVEYINYPHGLELYLHSTGTPLEIQWAYWLTWNTVDLAYEAERNLKEIEKYFHIKKKDCKTTVEEAEKLWMKL